MNNNENNQSIIAKSVIVKILAIVIIFSTLVGGIAVMFTEENKDVIKGEANFQLSYRYRLTNNGPLNLSSVILRLALTKTWDPVQKVNSILVQTKPNRTTTDEYENQFVWYEYENFEVNRSIDLRIDVNLTLYLLDFTNKNIPNAAYNKDSDLYRLYTVYHPLTDTTDPGVIGVAESLGSSNNPIDIAFQAYNFSSTSIKYRLLSQSKGASFALRNGYGDCDEYTTLFIALVRERGIPAIEHTAWLADFETGFETTDEGAAAHAYPMFYIENYGLLPADPTRGNTNLFDNWLKTDHKRITMTRGPDQPYRKLKYTWKPVEGVADPAITNNYTIFIKKLDINYFSQLRFAVITIIIGIPVVFTLSNIIKGRKAYKKNKEKLERILSPLKDS